ncbi:sugar phosphate isomerase/epimerase [archaeon]|nr:sugar phosphate isomerase/epimerase [archaeon]PJC45406.1 MAG: hypothetical protein CO037_01700 [Candidatus Pacearchaeota archaeon CG_4_9_14_0_2_um_filter_30_8]
MVKTNYSIENIYEPGYASFKPNGDSPFLGKEGMIPTNQLGLTTDPRTANQIASLSTALNQGMRVMEVGTIQPSHFETIPKQHFAEMRRKAKLAGAELTLHAPIVGTDPSGIGQQGYEESNRIQVERQLRDVIDKAIELDQKGNIPITIHGSNAAGSNWRYDGEGKDRKKVREMIVAVDRTSGQIIPIKEDMKFYAKPKVNKETGEVLDYSFKKNYSPEKQLENHNLTKWDDAMSKIEFQRENAERILKDVDIRVQAGIAEKKLNPRDEKVAIARQKMYFAGEYLQEASRQAQAEFNHAYKIAEETKDEKQIEALKKIAENYSNSLGIEKGKKVSQLSMLPSVQSHAIGALVESLRDIKTPEQFVPIEDFSVSKASETFSNAAYYAYKKKGEKAPALSIENLYQEMGFSQGEDLKNLVVNSREKFASKLVEKERISKSEADRVAAKLIGVTFDVGHLNMSKKFGYTDKELVKEAEKVGKFVNKVHLTDNFGFNDTHLPPGMGNVPFQALLEALGEEGAKAIKINEVGGWFEHFKSSPFPQILEAYGSPVYSTGSGPYWSQAAGFQQSYLEGYGQMLPSTNYQLFGAGFSQLPPSLGGQQGQQGGGRMGGGGF